MNPEMDFLSVAYILGAVQGGFLCLALWQKKQGHLQANRLLALFLLAFSMMLVNTFYEYSRYYLVAPHFSGVFWPVIFLFGPLLYLYIRTMTQTHRFACNKTDYWHFVPFLASYLLLTPYYLFPADDKIHAMSDGKLSVTALYISAAIASLIVSVGSVAQMGTYFFLSLKRLNQHSRRIREQFSYTEQVSLNWLRYLLYICLFLWMLYASQELFNFTLPFNLSNLTDFLIVVFIYVMGYIGLRQPVIFQGTGCDGDETREDEKSRDEQQAGLKKPKYEKSGLDRESGSAILAVLRDHMDSQQPYRDNALSINKLAQQLGIPVHYISQVINEHLGVNFFDFVNKYRIEAAKRELAGRRPEPVNVLQLAMDVGFNSKSAFYSVFRKYTNTTPSQYRRQCQVDDRPGERQIL